MPPRHPRARRRHTRGLLPSAAGSLLGAAALLLAGVTAPAEARAVGVSDFDQPLLGTTATAQWSRLPGSSYFSCDDEICLDLFLGFEDGEAAYIPSGPGSWGVLSTSPYLVGKVARFFWMPDGHYSTTSIIEVKPGTPTADLVKAMARSDFKGTQATAGQEITTNVTRPDGWTLWRTEPAVVRESPREAVHAAYATKGREVIRVFCRGQLPDPGNRCDYASDLAIAIARSAPKASFPSEAAALAPKRAAAGLTPVFAAEIDSADFWVEGADAPAAMEKSLGRYTLTLQWAVPGYPALTVAAGIAALPRKAGLKAFLADLCRPRQPCRLTDIAPAPASGLAAGVAARPDGAKGDWALEYQAGDNTKVTAIRCFATNGSDRALTTREVASCRKAIASVAQAVFAK